MPGVAEHRGPTRRRCMRAVPATTSGYAGLAVAAPDENSGGGTDNGGIEVLQGGAAGVTTTGAHYCDGSDVGGGVANNAEMGRVQPSLADHRLTGDQAAVVR